MNVGVCLIRIRLPGSSSLKEKRQVVKSIVSRIRNKFNVSVAEVGDNNARQAATLGVACVSNDGRFSNEVLSHVMDFIHDSRFDIEIVDYEIEIIAV